MQWFHRFLCICAAAEASWFSRSVSIGVSGCLNNQVLVPCSRTPQQQLLRDEKATLAQFPPNFPHLAERKLEQRGSGHKPCLSNPVVCNREISSSSLVDAAPVGEISCWSAGPEWETVHTNLSMAHSWTAVCQTAYCCRFVGAAVTAQNFCSPRLL